MSEIVKDTLESEVSWWIILRLLVGIWKKWTNDCKSDERWTSKGSKYK